MKNAVDKTTLTKLNTIASQQNKATRDTMQRVLHLLNYLAKGKGITINLSKSRPLTATYTCSL